MEQSGSETGKRAETQFSCRKRRRQTNVQAVGGSSQAIVNGRRCCAHRKDKLAPFVLVHEEIALLHLLPAAKVRRGWGNVSGGGIGVSGARKFGEGEEETGFGRGP